MTDLKLSATEVADVERVADAISADVINKVQAALCGVDWTYDLDAEDWVRVQRMVLMKLAQ